MAEEKKNKKLYSFKFNENFKKDLEIAAEVEEISLTKLIEREMNRYLRALKSAAIEMNRQKKIRDRVNDLKNQ